MTLRPARWIHMVGIGGAGMSGIARVLREQGERVSGSDLHLNSVTDQLSEIGVEIFEGHRASNLQSGIDLVVISSAIPASNEEVLAAADLNIPVIKRGQMLARMVNVKQGLAVAGAHGKTTTTSMLYTALAGSGLDPSFIVGGEIQGTQLNAHLGQDDYFVVEADESDASFLEIHPYAAIVTNIENDHLDFYKTVERIKEAFSQFLNQVHPEGFAMLYGADPAIQSIKDELRSRVFFYGEDSACDYYLSEWSPLGLGSTFEVYRRGDKVGKMTLSVPGKHNALNALAVTAVALELGLDFQAIQAALHKFPGAKRRFQIVYSDKDIAIVDDYAHHPTEIQATITAARQVHPGRLLVVFQPHRYTRTQLLAEQFGSCFKAADLVIITDVYSAGEDPLPGISGELVYLAAREAGCNAIYIPDVEDSRAYLESLLEPGDMLITMGAGDVWKIGAFMAAARSAAPSED
ncbi:MAG: UDP-N-acetylmuramate--L-alanine ligase [Syntrophomonadaceae bacterium]